MLRFLNESLMFSGFRQTGPLWLPLRRRVKYTCIVTYSGIFSRLLLEDCGWRSHTVVRLAHCGCFLSGSEDEIVLLATFSRCYFVWLAHCGCFLSGSGDEIVLLATFSWCYFVWLAHCGYLSSVLIATSWSQAFVRLVHCGCLLAEEWSLYLYIVT